MTDTPEALSAAMLGNVMNRILWSQSPAIHDSKTADLIAAQRIESAMAGS